MNKIQNKKMFVAGILFILLGCACVVLVIPCIEIEDPKVVYVPYVLVERDGFEKVIFSCSCYIDGEGRDYSIEQDAMDEYIKLSVESRNGFYYWYHVVYNNGSILSSEREYIGYGVNRTLMDFSEVFLSIIQNETGIRPSTEESLRDCLAYVLAAIGFFYGVVFGASLLKSSIGGCWRI